VGRDDLRADRRASRRSPDRCGRAGSPESKACDIQKDWSSYVTFLMAPGTGSQHPTFSMMAGDNWIGRVVGALEDGPLWESTAVFLTYDDCGCFYDHVPPLTQGMGLRMPMLIVSPYARPHFVDHTTATLASPLAYIESNWGLAPLGDEDRGTYDFRSAFDYSQTPLEPELRTFTPLPPWEVRYPREHPGQDQET
jgi:phospholipase C